MSVDDSSVVLEKKGIEKGMIDSEPDAVDGTADAVAKAALSEPWISSPLPLRKKGRRKTFVLDTNVLLHDPNAIFRFADNDVVIPIYCIEEIDQFKKDLSELGRSARQVARYLDTYRRRGRLGEGVTLETGGTLRVAFTTKQLPVEYANDHTQDNSILAVALDIREQNPDSPTIFVTKDVNLRIRADALGLQAENFEAERVAIDELYVGWRELSVRSDQIDTFYAEGVLNLDLENGTSDFHPNEFVLLKDPGNGSKAALGRVEESASGKIVGLRKVGKEGLWGIRPRNREQRFAVDLLLDDTIKLVTLVGKAGTGKTLLALAAGLHKTAEENVHQRLLVSRPIFPLGRDIGYLPGDVDAKLNPWMTPIYDNLELLLGLTKADRKNGRSYREFIDMGMVQIEPLTYIRGRSIPNQYMIVDEAQNLTPHEVKTILTRAGDDTKIVLTGDPYQIDNPYVDSSSNGLTYAVKRFQNQRIAGHVTLSKGERSALAELAANLL